MLAKYMLCPLLEYLYLDGCMVTYLILVLVST